MPTIATERGYRLHFWSKEGNPLEPPHVHVERGHGTAKYWLAPNVLCAKSRGFSNTELNEIESIVSKHRVTALRRWNDHFGTR